MRLVVNRTRICLIKSRRGGVLCIYDAHKNKWYIFSISQIHELFILMTLILFLAGLKRYQ